MPQELKPNQVAQDRQLWKLYSTIYILYLRLPDIN